MDREMQSVAELVRWRRRYLGWTLQKLAEEAGCSKSFLSHVERGKQVPNRERLARIESVMRMPRGVLASSARWMRTPPEIRERMARLESLCASGVGEDVEDAVSRGGVDVPLVGTVASVWGEGSGLGLDAEGGETGRAGVGDGRGASARGAREKAGDAAGRGEEGDGAAEDGVRMCETIRWPGLDDPGAIAARVVGAGMSPAYVEGDLVVLGSSVRAIKSGGDYLVTIAVRRGGKGAKWSGRARAGGGIGIEAALSRVYVDEEGDKEGAGSGSGGPRRVRLQGLDAKVAPRMALWDEIASARPVIGVMRVVG